MHAVVVYLSVRLSVCVSVSVTLKTVMKTVMQIMPHDRPRTLVFKWDVLLYRSCRISTDKPVARSLCHSRASFFARSANLPTGLYIVHSVISSFFTWDKLSQDLLDKFSLSFHQTKGICVNFLDPNFFLGPLPWQPILRKICEMTFIQHAGISLRIRISQIGFRGNKKRNFCYILCNFGEDRIH